MANTPSERIAVGGAAVAEQHRSNTKKNNLTSRRRAANTQPYQPLTPRRGISALFDGDIRYVLIDVSLFRHRVATSGRGCRPQRVDFLRNKLTRGHNARRLTRGCRLDERALTSGTSSGRSSPTSGGGSAVVVVWTGQRRAQGQQ
jgi:hypothetical protein